MRSVPQPQYFGSEDEPKKARLSFRAAVMAYIDAGGERRFLAPIVSYFGDKSVATIDTVAIAQCATKLYPNAASSTLNRQVYTPVSAVLKHAAAQGFCPNRSVRRPKQMERSIRWLMPAAADQLIAASSTHLRPLILFLLHTGARVSEALHLDWSQLDLANRDVQFAGTGHGSARNVTVTDCVREALAELRHRRGGVFRRPDGAPYARKIDAGGQIKTAFAGACRRAAIVDFAPRDCRHSWAIWYFARHRDVDALMHVGGWADERGVRAYTTLPAAELDRVRAEVGDRLETTRFVRDRPRLILVSDR